MQGPIVDFYLSKLPSARSLITTFKQCQLLSAAAGWNHTPADWQFLLLLQPDGCLLLECAGRIVATTTLICYGDRLAWLGMVLTHPEFRRGGFARRLVEAALKIAETKGMQTVKLDATDLGRPLYESLGFRFEQWIERWSRSGAVRNFEPVASAGTPDYEMDGEAFGADRSLALQRLAAGALTFSADHSFAVLRNGARAAYLGPCVARLPEAAKLVMESCLAACQRDCYWDLLPANQQAVDLARQLNFKFDRRLTRMARGAGLRGNESMILRGCRIRAWLNKNRKIASQFPVVVLIVHHDFKQVNHSGEFTGVNLPEPFVSLGFECTNGHCDLLPRAAVAPPSYSLY